MINGVIETIRKQLYEVAEPEEFTSQHTLLLSNELNQFLNYHTKTTYPGKRIDYTSPKVHANAIHNILEVASKENLDLSYLLETEIPKQKSWYKLNLVSSLLDYVSTKYGWEAVEYMGEFVPENCIFPMSIQSFQDSLHNLNDIYHSNHKAKVYIGEYLPYQTSNNEILMFCYTPHYPASFNHGIIKGMSKKFNHSIKLSSTNMDHGGQFKISL